MITGIRKEKLVAEMNIRTHKIVSGVVEKLGGRDEGPNPHELLEAALAACTIITAQMYADRKGIKLDSADVEVKIISEGKDSILSREISFKGDLSQEDISKLSEIVEKCPIHKLLESNVKINTLVKN